MGILERNGFDSPAEKTIGSLLLLIVVLGLVLIAVVFFFCVAFAPIPMLIIFAIPTGLYAFFKCSEKKPTIQKEKSFVDMFDKGPTDAREICRACYRRINAADASTITPFRHEWCDTIV